MNNTKKNSLLYNYSDVPTVEDVMKILHIDRSKVYELLQSKVIQSIRVGKKYIIPKTIATTVIPIYTIYNLIEWIVVALKGDKTI